jgi:hypothetical protein
MRICGTDPGRNGALALIDSEAGTLAVAKMPMWERKLATTSKLLVWEDGLTDLLTAWKPDVFWIEDVWARGGRQGPEEGGHREGATQSFSFGYAKAILVGVAGALRIPRLYVPPAKWKAELKVSADKMLAKRLAHQLFPDCVKILSSEAKCEAAMITLYGALAAGVKLGRLSPVK